MYFVVLRDDQAICVAAKFVRHPKGGAKSFSVTLEV